MEDIRDINGEYESHTETDDIISQMYFDDKVQEKDYLFSLTLFQTVLCIILTAIVFLMSFFGPFKAKLIEAADYFQSIELTKSGVKEEIEAMKSFLTNAEG